MACSSVAIAIAVAVVAITSYLGSILRCRGKEAAVRCAFGLRLMIPQNRDLYSVVSKSGNEVVESLMKKTHLRGRCCILLPGIAGTAGTADKHDSHKRCPYGKWMVRLLGGCP